MLENADGPGLVPETTPETSRRAEWGSTTTKRAIHSHFPKSKRAGAPSKRASARRGQFLRLQFLPTKSDFRLQFAAMTNSAHDQIPRRPLGTTGEQVSSSALRGISSRDAAIELSAHAWFTEEVDAELLFFRQRLE